MLLSGAGSHLSVANQHCDLDPVNVDLMVSGVPSQFTLLFRRLAKHEGRDRGLRVLPKGQLLTAPNFR